MTTKAEFKEMEPQIRIVFFIVNYFNENEVIQFVSSQFSNLTNRNIQIMVINNGSNNQTALVELEKKFSFVGLLEPEENLGYFGALNFGLSKYLEVNKDYPDATIICNTDISLERPNFFDNLLRVTDRNDFDVMGPDIYSTFLKYHQNPYIKERTSKFRIKLYKFVTSNYLLYNLFTLIHFLKTKISKSNFIVLKREDCYAIHGSFMIFNKTYFQKGASIKYPSFLFGEELFVAETALKVGLKIVYEPSLVIHHHQHSTTGNFKSKKVVRFMHQSYDYLLKTFFQDKD